MTGRPRGRTIYAAVFFDQAPGVQSGKQHAGFLFGGQAVRYLQVAAAAVLAAALVMAVGCEQQAPSGTAESNGPKLAEMQKQLDQLNQDLKAAQDELAKINNQVTEKIAENQNLQKQLDAANAKIAEMTQTIQEVMKLAAPTVAPSPSPQ
jgi:septal ring factor EnvC (AmiA/AmiB activator)